MAQPSTASTSVETVPSQRKGLWIEVRDSESGERRISIYSAPVPRTRTERERLLNHWVPQIFPGAKLRTYAGGVAKFVLGPLLIAAHYGAVRPDAELIPIEEADGGPIARELGQGTLFAA
jgi:hypothetical protein